MEQPVSYLAKRGSVYYFRRTVPKALRAIIGEDQWMQSLDVKDLHEAKRLRTIKLLETDRQIEAAEAALAAASQPPVPPKSQAQLDRERARWEWEREQEELQALYDEQAEMEIEELTPIMDAIEAGTVPDASPADLARAGQLLALHERQMAPFRVAEQNREAAEAFRNCEPVTPEREASQPKGKSLYLDTDIMGGWAAEMQPDARGKAAYASSAKLFYSTMGRKSVELVSKADVMAYKNKLIAEGRSQTNVRDHLAYIRTLFKWAAQNDHIPANPAQDVRMAVKVKAEKRQDFNIDDLNALFAGPVHAEGHRPKDVRAGGEAAYWMPLLALFMGARREEIGQLRVSDVQQAPYIDAEEKRQEVWCINITDAADDGEGLANQLKNAGSRRLIPLHPKLIELGFTDYVQGLPDQRGRVFPALKPIGIGQKLTDKWGQWFSQYRKACGITDKLKVFHSFRHTWKTYAVDAGMAERICRQFQGHEGKDAADKYGTAPSMRVLVEAIASYRVPGLVILAP